MAVSRGWVGGCVERVGWWLCREGGLATIARGWIGDYSERVGWRL